MADLSDIRREVGQQSKQLWDEQDKWSPHWREIQAIMLPYRGRLKDVETQNDGKEQADDRVDGTATRALRVLASGMHGGLTSPSQRWFRLSLGDQRLSRFSAVREWLDEVESVIYSHLRRSNFYTAVQNIYLEEGGFGTATLFSEEHSSGRGLWYRVITIGDYVLATDSQGRINTLVRRDWLTGKQLVDTFGIENLSPTVQNSVEKNPFDYHKVMHGVQPRQGFDPTIQDAKNMPFVSAYWEDSWNEGFLRLGGFREFPFMATRWDVVGNNVYGYSPGMDALPDVRGLNQVAEDLLTAVNKEVDPPVNIPDSLGDDVDLLPGGRNPSSGNEHVTATYQISPNLSAGFEIKNGLISDVNEWFFHNLFILSANPNATATEIARKNEEQLVQLGPVIQRQFTELLNPAIERAFKILERQGFIPEAPPELADTEIEVEYISTLAQAQKLVGVQKIERFSAFVANAAQFDPQILDNLDGDAMVDVYGEGVGVPAKILRSDAEIKEIRENRAAQQRAAAEAEEAAMAAQTAATLSNAKLGEDSALTAVAEQESA